MTPVAVACRGLQLSLFVAPRPASVNAALAEAAARVNRGFRARTAELAVADEDWTLSEFKAHAGGHTVDRAYARKSRRPVGTSVVGVVWAAGGDGLRYVLTAAARGAVWPGAARRYPFGFDAREWSTRTPHALLRSVVHQILVPELSSLVPSCQVHPDDPAPVEAYRALLRLVDADPERAGRDEAAAWLRAYTRLADARPGTADPP